MWISDPTPCASIIVNVHTLALTAHLVVILKNSESVIETAKKKMLLFILAHYVDLSVRNLQCHNWSKPHMCAQHVLVQYRCRHHCYCHIGPLWINKVRPNKAQRPKKVAAYIHFAVSQHFWLDLT